MYKNVTHRHPRHTICAGVSGVTKDAGPASCAIVASQWAGGAVRDGEVLFSVFFVGRVPFPNGFCEYWLDMVGIGMAFFVYKIFLPNKYYSMCEHGITPPNYC